MPRIAVRAALAAAVAVAVAAVPAPGDVTGNVNGALEQQHIATLVQALEIEGQAKDAADAVPANQPLTGDAAVAVISLLEASLELLDATAVSIGQGGPFQSTTYVGEAKWETEAAAFLDRKAIKAIQEGKTRFQAMASVSDAKYRKGFAIDALAAVLSTKRDLAAREANGQAPGTFVRDGEIKSTRTAAKVTKQDLADGTGHADGGKSAVKKEKAPTEGGSALVLAAAKAPPPNFYYSFEGTGTTPGYLFKTFGRRLFGPFEIRFQVGMFDPNKTGDSGSACIELDLEGSAPLQYFATCGRRISSGVQVFAQGNDGAAGNAFFAGAAVVEVVIAYDGTTFSCSAKPRGASDDDLVPFATYDGLPQGETALIGGLGASGLTKGTPIGLDEIYITAK
jgi:hypothetical protein